MQTGWVSKQLDYGTEEYYFDLESGEQLLGWQDIDGKRYYFSKFGAHRSYKDIANKRYYFDPDTCELKIGWFEEYGNKYYADPNDGGALVYNKTLVIDGVSYTFGSYGFVINNEP